MRETRWRAWEQLHHISSPLYFRHVSRLLLFSSFFLKERTGSTVTVLAVQYTAERASLNVETERLLYTLLTSPPPPLCCILVLQGYGARLRRPGKGHVQPERPSASSRPHLTLLCLSERALSIHCALIWQRKWIRNSFILPLHIYSFHRLWPLPTCVLISSWRAALSRASATLKPHRGTHDNFWDPRTEADDTHTHTHTRYAWRPHTRTNQETHQKDVDDIIYDGFNWWWCNSEPTLSEACPLQKHSSHYNNIKGNLEEAASLLEASKMYWNLKKKKKKNCRLVFSIPHFCFGAPLAFPEVQQVLWKHCREE